MAKGPRTQIAIVSALIVILGTLGGVSPVTAVASGCTTTGLFINCNILEDTGPIALSTTGGVLGPGPSYIVMCEASPCDPAHDTGPSNWSDVLFIQTCAGGCQPPTCNGCVRTTVTLLSDVETPTGTCFQDQVPNGPCIPIGTIQSNLALGNTQTVIPSESAQGILTLTLFRNCGTIPFLNECTTLNLISDGSGNGELSDTPLGVPQFGVPAFQIAAVGVFGLILIRLLFGLQRPRHSGPSRAQGASA